MAGTENDLNNFSTSSSHRLPTISATEALRSATERAKRIPTGLRTLDDRLGLAANSSSSHGGVPRGELTELYGPPGVGKTSFALQLTINAVCSSSAQCRVIWISTGTPPHPRRIRQLLHSHQYPNDGEPSASPPGSEVQEDLLDKIIDINLTSLPHLLTFFLHPTPDLPSPDVSLIVIDDLSRFVLSSLPATNGKLRKAALNNIHLSSSLHDKLAKRATARKWNMIGELGHAMQRMAQKNNLSVLAINQTATSLRTHDGGSSRKAILKSAFAVGKAWTQAVGTRLVLWRDFLPAQLMDQIEPLLLTAKHVRFVDATKIAGKDFGESAVATDHVMFYINDDGLQELNILPSSHSTTDPAVFKSSPPLGPSTVVVQTSQRNNGKRKHAEVVDSEDEDDYHEPDSERGMTDPDFEQQEQMLLDILPDRTYTDHRGDSDPVLAEDGDPLDEDDGQPLLIGEDTEAKSGQAEEEMARNPFENLSEDEDLTPDEEEYEPP